MIGQEVPLLDHGFIALDDVMGDDRTPAQKARTSFRNRKRPRTVEEDARLTDYLIRNKHTTPLEFCQVRFYFKAPLFVGEQVLRHRTASVNKISYRYVKAEREFYVPAPERMHAAPKNNKQGSSHELIAEPNYARMIVEESCDAAFDYYDQLLRMGLAPEIARTVLPTGTYTEWYWQNDLHNTLHFLKLRLDSHAQWEIRAYAEAMLDLLKPIYPTIISSWEKHNAGS